MFKFLKKILNSIPEFPGVSLFRKQEEFVDLKNSNKNLLKRRLLGRMLLFIVLLFLIFLFQVNLYIQQSNHEIKQLKGIEPYTTTEYATDKLKRRYTILVLGKEDRNRADTIILCHVFLDTGKVHLLSLPRDTRVPLLKDGEVILDKLNHTYRWGGLAMLKDSLTRFLHIKIDHSIVVDLKLFKKIIDTLGGVKLEVLRDLYYVDKAGGLTIDIKKGLQILNGKNAEGYVRYRADGLGDLGRIKRQRKFIHAFEQRLRDLFSFRWKNIAFIGRLPHFFVSLFKDVETDLNADLVFKLLLRFRDMKKGSLQHKTLKGEGLYLHVKNYKKKISFYVSSRLDKIKSYSWFMESRDIPKELLDPLSDSAYFVPSKSQKQNKSSSPSLVSSSVNKRDIPNKNLENLKSIKVQVVKTKPISIIRQSVAKSLPTTPFSGSTILTPSATSMIKVTSNIEVKK
ncbi:LCP family protein [bacterium]|nr:LCP family protein [bacterium]